MAFSDICRVYEHDNKYLVLNPLVPSWIVTNINGVLLLKLYDEEKTFEQVADEFLDYAPDFSRKSLIGFLKKADEALLFDIPKENIFHKPYFLNGVYLNMTDVCNLHCIYCFATERQENHQKLSFDDYKKILSEIAWINTDIEIMFTGGEPLISDLTIPVANYAKKMGFHCKLMTNGTLINDTNIDEIIAAFDTIRISIDGSSKEIHEFYRGNSTFKKTEDVINRLIYKGANVVLAMVVTKHNRSDVWKMSQKWGARLTLQPLFPLGNSKLHQELYLSREEYYEALTSNINIVPYADLGSVIERHKSNKSLLKCAMGDGEISISCSGDVYPCQLLHIPEYCVGNVLNDSLINIYKSERMARFKYHTVFDIDKCKECDLRLLCGGACQARHYSETGSIDKAGKFCNYEKKGIIEGLVNSAIIQDL